MFVETVKGGIVFLYYDNVHGYFLDLKEAREFLAQLQRNMSAYNVVPKYCWLYEDIPGPDAVPKDGEERPLFPEALGIEYCQRRVPRGYDLLWRPCQEKVLRLKSDAVERAQSARQVAHVTGRVLPKTDAVSAATRWLEDAADPVGRWKISSQAWMGQPRFPDHSW